MLFGEKFQVIAMLFGEKLQAIIVQIYEKKIFLCRNEKKYQFFLGFDISTHYLCRSI